MRVFSMGRKHSILKQIIKILLFFFFIYINESFKCAYNTRAQGWIKYISYIKKKLHNLKQCFDVLIEIEQTFNFYPKQ